MSKNYFDFNWLIYPFDTPTFLEKYWEQKPLFIKRQILDYYCNLFSLESVDSVISFTSANDWAVADIRLANKHIPGMPRKTSLQQTPIDQLYSLYAQGTTVVLNHLQKRWKPLSLLATNLQNFFSCRVHINMYLTPKNAQGFNVHYDTHDVFVLQIEGSKLWRIYEPAVILPLANEREDNYRGEEKVGNLIQEICLKTGDLLFMPRGYVHEAIATDSSSLHLTVGINPIRWSNVISHILDSVSQQELSFRKSLPIGCLTHNENTSSLELQLSDLLQRLADTAKIPDALEKLAEIFYLEQYPSLPDGHFTTLDALESITLNTILVKRPGMTCRVTTQDSKVSIFFPGNQIKGPKKIESALRFIATVEQFTPKQLPDELNDEAKLVLVRRLIKEGLLTILKS